jgi:hypothetical protein
MQHPTMAIRIMSTCRTGGDVRKQHGFLPVLREPFRQCGHSKAIATNAAQIIHEIGTPDIMGDEPVIFHERNAISCEPVPSRPAASGKAGRDNAGCRWENGSVGGEDSRHPREASQRWRRRWRNHIPPQAIQYHNNNALLHVHSTFTKILGCIRCRDGSACNS